MAIVGPVVVVLVVLVGVVVTGGAQCSGTEAFGSPARIRLETNHHTTATRQHRSRKTVSTEIEIYIFWQIKMSAQMFGLDQRQAFGFNHSVGRHHLKHHHKHPKNHHMILGQG